MVLWFAVSSAAGLFRALLVAVLHSWSDPDSLGLAGMWRGRQGKRARTAGRIHRPRGQSGGWNPARDGQRVQSPPHCCWYEHVALRKNWKMDPLFSSLFCFFVSNSFVWNFRLHFAFVWACEQTLCIELPYFVFDLFAEMFMTMLPW